MKIDKLSVSLADNLNLEMSLSLALAPHQLDYIQGLQKKCTTAEKKVDAVYLERNVLVALLARLFPSGVAKTDILGWDPEWHNCVFIEFPWGQASWHYHDSSAKLFEGLPKYLKPWDGHTTKEKYQKIKDNLSIIGLSQKNNSELNLRSGDQTITPKQLHILQHALGLDKYGQGVQHRNHFVTGPDGDDYKDCLELVIKGFLTRPSRPINSSLTGGDELFIATPNGIQYVVRHSPQPPKPSKSKQRYRRFLEFGDSFKSFIDFCRWDASPERSWNGGGK